MINSVLRVLLVEDNLLDQRVLLKQLANYEQTDFDVTVVGDLAAAVDEVGSGAFDCLLLDLSLPDSEGLASVDALLTRSVQTPIVVLSGLADPVTSLLAVERGAQDYLLKGAIDPELIGRAVNYAVARHHSDKQLAFAQERLEVLEERDRIARDLHDTVIQQLFATGMSLQSVSARLSDEEHRKKVNAAIDGIDSGIKQLREAIYGLHDHSQTRTLREAILQVAADEESALGFAPTVRLDAGLENLSEELAHDLVATLREGLSNAAKHAAATTVQVLVEIKQEEVVLRVIDNGIGYSGDSDAPSDTLGGRGLRNMQRRADAQAGHFTLRPGPGGGTELTWRVRRSLG